VEKERGRSGTGALREQMRVIKTAKNKESKYGP
jgi:hypothetical protein